MLRKIPLVLSLTMAAVLAVAPVATALDTVKGEFDLSWNGCVALPVWQT
jgi:hypothetical protein